MDQYKRLFMGLFLLIGVAGSFILYLSWPLLTGKTLILATRPVDPFDILRGQYIIINYEISTIPSIEGAKEKSNVYVLLKEEKSGDNKIWRYKNAFLNKPKNGDFIKGNIKSIYGDSMSIEYGTEQFFFERNAEFVTANMTVEVKVDNSGQARIVELLMNGKSLNITYKKPTLTS